MCQFFPLTGFLQVGHFPCILMAEVRQAPQNTWPQVVDARKEPFSFTSTKLSRQTGHWEVWASLEEEEEGGGD